MSKKIHSPTDKTSDSATPAGVKESAQDIACRALEQMETLGLSPIPQLYELWFRYYQRDPEIMKAVDQYQGQIDEVACHKIYKRFLSDTARDDVVKTVSDQMQQALAEVVNMLGSLKTATTDYGETLDDMSAQISKADTIEDLSQIVSVIVEDTKKMVEKNQKLELQLVNSSQQVSELRQNLDVVRREAMTDGLTGLHNRKSFDKQIMDCVENARGSKAPLVLMMLDIDHFKTFNDTFGHQTGDQVLRLVARTLTDGVKGRDIAARYGGEEFAIILPDTPLSAGLKVAETLRMVIEHKEVINKSSQQHLGSITLSIGVAEYANNESVPDFVERADLALYQAKLRGRNRVAAAP